MSKQHRSPCATACHERRIHRNWIVVGGVLAELTLEAGASDDEDAVAIRLATVASCPFCEYIAGGRDGGFVRRGPLVSALVNRTQYETGALLIIPNRHLSTVLDLDSATLEAVGSEAQLLGRTLVQHFGATGINIFQNNGVDANQHYPHYHMHVVPRYPGSDPTRIYSERDFEPISIAQQRELAERISRAIA